MCVVTPTIVLAPPSLLYSSISYLYTCDSDLMSSLEWLQLITCMVIQYTCIVKLTYQIQHTCPHEMSLFAYLA